MKRHKQFTIVQLQSQMQETLNFIFGSNVEISHALSSERGGRKILGRHTTVYVPIADCPVIARRQKKAAKKVIAGCYDRVKRVVSEAGYTQRGSTGAPVTRAIRFEHE